MYRRQNYSGADAIIQPTFKGLVAVAYGWSDLPDESRPHKQNAPEILPSGLLDMATYWRSMTTRNRPKRSRNQRQTTSP
jgi:hypothetical protein